MTLNCLQGDTVRQISRSWHAAVISAIFAVSLAGTAAFGQAGNTGGTIANRDKSVSGDNPSERSDSSDHGSVYRKPAREHEPVKRTARRERGTGEGGGGGGAGGTDFCAQVRIGVRAAAKAGFDPGLIAAAKSYCGG